MDGILVTNWDVVIQRQQYFMQLHALRLYSLGIDGPWLLTYTLGELAWTKERRDRVKRSTRKQPRKANAKCRLDFGNWKRCVRWLMAYISRLLHTCDRAFESRAIVLPVLFRPISISTYKFSKQDAIEELLCTECRHFFCLLGKQSDWLRTLWAFQF